MSDATLARVERVGRLAQRLLSMGPLYCGGLITDLPAAAADHVDLALALAALVSLAGLDDQMVELHGYHLRDPQTLRADAPGLAYRAWESLDRAGRIHAAMASMRVTLTAHADIVPEASRG